MDVNGKNNHLEHPIPAELRAEFDAIELAICTGEGSASRTFTQMRTAVQAHFMSAATAAPTDLPECGCCGQTGECDADCDARQAQAEQQPRYGTYKTTPGESVAGIALRQLGEESRWVEIRDLNAHAFPDIGPDSYYPVGTLLTMPAAPIAQPAVTALVEALEACRNELYWMIERHNQQSEVDGSWLHDYQTVWEADKALAKYRAALVGKGGE